MKVSEEISELAVALSKAQSEMGPAVKNCTNPFHKSRYADLASVWEAIRSPLTSNGLCLLQEVVTTQAGVSVTTKLFHSSGQWIEFGPLEVPLGKRDAHSVGSATTYAKRYAISAALGVVTEDEDDGNMAKESVKNSPAKKEAPKTTVETIGESGAMELADVLKDFPDYKAEVYSYLERQKINLNQVPKEDARKIFAKIEILKKEKSND